MAVSKRTRFEVLRRDNYTCRYCRSVDNRLRVDHVTPKALGGSDDPINLVTACQDCNSGKSSVALSSDQVADIAEDAVRWSAAMKKAGEILAEKASGIDEYIGAFYAAWPQYRYLPEGVDGTLIRLYEAGLPESVMVDAVHVAATNKGIYNRFGYFAGICWKRVRAMQEIAQQIVAGDDAP